MGEETYIERLLGGNDRPTETSERALLRRTLQGVLDGKNDVEVMVIAGDLIAFIRDDVLSALAGIRRSATVGAKGTMTADEISKSTGLSRATISRLLTENRNY